MTSLSISGTNVIPAYIDTVIKYQFYIVATIDSNVPKYVYSNLKTLIVGCLSDETIINHE